MAREAKHPIDREMRWNFGDSRSTPLRWMSFWLRRRLTASNSSLEKSRGWWVSTNSTGKPSSGSALNGAKLRRI